MSKVYTAAVSIIPFQLNHDILTQVNALKVSLSHHPCTYFKFLWKPAYFSLLANAYIGNV